MLGYRERHNGIWSKACLDTEGGIMGYGVKHAWIQRGA